MGLFSRDKMIATFTVDFFSKEDAHVTFWSSKTDPSTHSLDASILAFSYLGKILFNLNAIPAPDMHLEKGQLPLLTLALVDNLITKGLATGTLDRQAVEALVPKLSNGNERPVVKTYLGQLWQKSNGSMYPQTPMASNARGGEPHFAPYSIVAIVKHLMLSMDTRHLMFLYFGLRGALEFYGTTAAYQDIRGTAQGEQIAFAVAQDGLKKYLAATAG